MKVNTISPFANATPNQILEFISISDALLTILPGNLAKQGNPGNHPTLADLQLSIQDNKYVFMEVRDELGKWPSIISKHKIVKMPKQLFAQKPKRSDIQNLMNIWDDRTQEFSSDGKKVHITFIICGEINGFNPDGNLKFGYSFQRTNLVNPCHTIMGRWYVLNRKLENLSIGHKMIYVSNNDRSSPKITTSLRIYDNGHQVEVRRQVPGLMWAQIEI